MQFLLDHIHIHLFSPFDLTDSLETAKSLRSKLKDKLDGEPIVLPVPDSAPPDLPSILLKSKDGKYTCHVSSVKLELSYSEPGLPKYRLDEFKDDYLSLVGNTIDAVKFQLKSKISSIGITIELIALSEDPVTYLKEIYIKEGLLTSATQLGITYMDKLRWYDLQINRGYRLYAGTFSDESGSKYKMVTMYCDINTLSADKKDYDKDIAMNIIKQAISYVSENIDIVFPQSQ
jgi:hypothetical protein